MQQYPDHQSARKQAPPMSKVTHCCRYGAVYLDNYELTASLIVSGEIKKVGSNKERSAFVHKLLCLDGCRG